MLKPPPSPKKAKPQDPEDDLHKYAAPGEHIEIPAWKRSGLVMDVQHAHYGDDAGRRYLVAHSPSDEKGTWYQLEPHHFVNNDNPQHAKLAQAHAKAKAQENRERAAREKDPGERQVYMQVAAEYDKHAGGRGKSNSDWKAWGSNKATAEKRMKAARSGSASAKNVPGAMKGSSLPNSYSQRGQVHD